MRSASSAVLVPALLATLAACRPVDVNSPAIRGVGYVRVDDVVKRHPLYQQVSQLDDAIAAIHLAALGHNVPLSAAEISSQTTELNRELQAAQNRAGAIIAQKQVDYHRREQAAVAAALAAAGQSNAGALAARQVSTTSAGQAQSAAMQANQNLIAYQQSVVSQDSAAVAAVGRQLQMQAGQTLRAKAQQLAQSEGQLALQLSQQDATQRLSIKTRLSNLALDEATRSSLHAQLAEIDRRETTAINAQRARDQAVLNALQAQLNAATSSQMRAQSSAIQSQTRAKLDARRNEVVSQLRGLGPPQLPTNLPAATRTKIEDIHKQFATQFEADAQKTVDEYNTTKAELDMQFQALHGADIGATTATAKQLADLQKHRGDLYNQILDQIKRETARIARERGLKVAFGNVDAAPGGYDLTDEVIKDVESLHE